VELRARHHGGEGRSQRRLACQPKHEERRAHVSKTHLPAERRAHCAATSRRLQCTGRKGFVDAEEEQSRRGEQDPSAREWPDDRCSFGGRRERPGRPHRARTSRGTRCHTLLRGFRTACATAGSRAVNIERRGHHPLRARLPRRPRSNGQVSPQLLPMLVSTALLAGMGLLMVKVAVEKHMLEWKRRRCPRCGSSVKQHCRCRAR
jgi:hypothetical protein